MDLNAPALLHRWGPGGWSLVQDGGYKPLAARVKQVMDMAHARQHLYMITLADGTELEVDAIRELAAEIGISLVSR